MGASLRAWIEQSLGGDPTTSEEIMADCINCGKEKHLYINSRTGLAICFRCGYKANLKRIIIDLTGATPYQAEITARALLQGTRKKSARKKLIHHNEELDALRKVLSALVNTNAGTQYQEVELPQGRELLDAPASRIAMRYLNSRGFSDRHTQRLPMYYIPKSAEQKNEALYKFNGHMLFVDYYPGKPRPRYFTSRRVDTAFSERQLNKYPKSYHVADSTHKGLAFGETTWCSDDRLFLVEGPLDMLALAGYACCLLGKQLSLSTALALVKSGKKLIVCLDDDARAYTYKAVKMLRHAGAESVYVSSGFSGDPGDRAPLGIDKAVAFFWKRANKVTGDFLIHSTAAFLGQ